MQVSLIRNFPRDGVVKRAYFLHPEPVVGAESQKAPGSEAQHRTPALFVPGSGTGKMGRKGANFKFFGKFYKLQRSRRKIRKVP